MVGGALSFVSVVAGARRAPPRAGELIARRAAKAAAPAKSSGGALIKDGDAIWLKSHSGCYLNAEDGNDDVKARSKVKAPRATLTIEKEGGGSIVSHDKVNLKGFKGGYMDIQGDMVRMKFQDRSRCNGLQITKEGMVGETHKAGTQADIREGDRIFFRGGDRTTYLDIEGQDVRARWPDEGKWQVLIIEKAE